MIKTIFLSTSNRMLPLLKKLHCVSDVKLCITKTDVKVGRKQELVENGIKLWCLDNNIECLQINNVKDNIDNIIEKVKKINPDLSIMVDFGFIIPESLLNIFEDKIINIHYSLLPKYRGASPIQFAILNGDKVTGITYQRVDKEMDKGVILRQVEYKIQGNETTHTLLEQLLDLNVKDLSTFIELYETKKLEESIQLESKAIYTTSPTHPDRYTIFKEDAYTDLNEAPTVLERKVRAFSPWPILWSTLGKVSSYIGLELKDKSKEKLTVKIYEGHLENNKFVIDTIQVEGKNKTNWKEFKNGYLI